MMAACRIQLLKQLVRLPIRCCECTKDDAEAFAASALNLLALRIPQAAGQVSKKLQQCTVRTSPSRGLLEAQQHKSQYAALDASNNK
jgi:hypothetical protein